MPLELQLFGVPELRLDGRRIQLTRKSSWAMLAYLALSGVPHAREVLTGLFGGNGTEDQARRRISNALAEMRHEIGPCLLTSWSVVGFRPEVTCVSDVQRFEMYLRQAREQDDATALRAAADLYRGEFLAGLSLKCSPDFEMWLLLQRESYHAQFVVAAEELIASAGRRSAWIDGEWAARRLLELELKEQD